MKKRYTIEKTKYKEWFNITDHKEERSFWMHINDFGVINKHLPKYCTNDVRELFEPTQTKEKS